MANPNGPPADPHVERMARQLSLAHGPTRVVLSFGAFNGGAYFARWLRWQIMQRRGWSRINSVYLDTEALKLVPDTKIEVKDNSRPWLTGIASMNGGWHGYYRYAMSEAHTMLFALTREWMASQWCRQEADDFRDENEQRRRAGKAPLRGVSIVFDGEVPPIPGTQVLHAQKQDVDGAIPQKEQIVRADPTAGQRFGVTLRAADIAPTPGWGGLFTMDGASLLRVLQAIGQP